MPVTINDVCHYLTAKQYLKVLKTYNARYSDKASRAQFNDRMVQIATELYPNKF